MRGHRVLADDERWEAGPDAGTETDPEAGPETGSEEDSLDGDQVPVTLDELRAEHRWLLARVLQVAAAVCCVVVGAALIAVWSLSGGMTTGTLLLLSVVFLGAGVLLLLDAYSRTSGSRTTEGF